MALEPLPETMLPCASTLALREALLDPSSSDEFVRRIGLALTYNGGHQHDRIKTEVVLARKELTIRLLEDGRLPLAALPSVLWYPEALPRWRTALHEAGGGDEDAVSALLKSWAGRETEVWECLSLLRALKQVLDDQSASGRSWLITHRRHHELIKAGPDAHERARSRERSAMQDSNPRLRLRRSEGYPDYPNRPVPMGNGHPS